MPKSTTTCPVCGKTDIRADNLKRHMEANHRGQQPAPTNRVVMEEAAATPPKKAEKKEDDTAAFDATYTMKDFVALYKAKQLKITKDNHKDIFGTTECNDRCKTCRHRTFCDYEPSLSMYSTSTIEGMYRSWAAGMKKGHNTLA